MYQQFHCDGCEGVDFFEVHQIATVGGQMPYSRDYRPKIRCANPQCNLEFVLFDDNINAIHWERVRMGS